MFIGREKELSILRDLKEQNNSSFVAIYGRRRIGKTEMVRYFCDNEDVFFIEFTGKRKVSKQNQIRTFLRNIEKKFNNKVEKVSDWYDAFELLQENIDTWDSEKKKVIFIDELPWLDSAKSNFLEELAYFWNTYCTRRKDIILIVCGSAASYMIKKVIHNIGPLHGRLTAIIPMEQFSLASTKKMLTSKGCNYSDKAVVDTYMAFGGVAKYIENISCKKVLSENINALCFQDTGLMRYEYEELFSSLFNESKTHYLIMSKLSSKWSGWTQKELAKLVKISSGSMKKPLDELYTSGFISKTTKFGNIKKEVIYRATDCFSYFHNKWIKGASKGVEWNQISTTQSYKSWSGFAFENICHMHTEQIKKLLGINGVPTQTHYWSYKEEGQIGTQIDMLIEHTNGSKNIDIIECKYYNGKFVIDKKYKENLQQKINIFNKETGYKHNIRLIMITSNGVEKNEHYGDVVNIDFELSDILSVGF